mmetsp:Transcript_34648/g.58065  ORF Transcript_34648/g.58065 Transcript_34648/m.58065 type:complete len:478 (-) Transcript_34648:110-1543(-)|eukprot:CAMPEP_0184337570 /NCGR_PEP_ID=MMETSP1089-20130417/5970_1 /TAXON_ID=38269 ORGANISM="Gloeochaete wittrockiana, Strain SAG46.84" /NCGR_SAMPLE_ID=MMETSP1089 /ASSEMBLY_ACC=CAM_ASM_000445 /LENGTH=477 /DNA_ID=CAMNT_0026663399 /DNA_START=51 /DNA_END=1484 /DNA_ORIENTATION=-
MVRAEDLTGELIHDRFSVVRRIGGKSDVYAGVDLTSGDAVAVKCEEYGKGKGELDYEASVYDELHDRQTQGVLKKIWHGKYLNFEVLVLELAGPCLKDLFLALGRRFSLKTVLMLADQMIDRIACIHRLGYILRKVKPRDFVMGIGPNSHSVFPIDFGLFKRYRCPRTGRHVHMRSPDRIMARVKYASKRVNRLQPPSRRDDLESLGYMLVYFLKGDLPWGPEAADAWDLDGEMAVAEKKESTPISELCAGLPDEFQVFFHYVHDLGFEDEPNYAWLQGLFRGLFHLSGFVCDWSWDWTDSHHVTSLTPLPSPSPSRDASPCPLPNLASPSEGESMPSSPNEPHFSPVGENRHHDRHRPWHPQRREGNSSCSPESHLNHLNKSLYSSSSCCEPSSHLIEKERTVSKDSVNAPLKAPRKTSHSLADPGNDSLSQSKRDSLSKHKYTCSKHKHTCVRKRRLSESSSDYDRESRRCRVDI